MSGDCKCRYFPLGQANSAAQTPQLDLRGYCEAGKERGKGKEGKGMDGTGKNNPRNICQVVMSLNRVSKGFTFMLCSSQEGNVPDEMF